LRFFTTSPIFTSAVNNQDVVNIAGRFEAEAARVLRGIPRVGVTFADVADDGIDATVRYAGREVDIAVQFKQRVSAATAWQLAHRAAVHPGVPLLLIAGETTAEAREILEQNGIALVDGLGNAHLELPGLLMHVVAKRGKRQPALGAKRTALKGKAGVAAQALLLDSGRLWQVQDLAAVADISTGLAHRVLARLEADEIVHAEGSGPGRVRRVVNPSALLDLWAEETAERTTRTTAFLLAQTPKQLMGKLASGLDHAGIEHALTGAAGASLVAPFVTAIPVVEVWVMATASPDELYAATQAEPVVEGPNVVFLQAKDDTPLAFREQTNSMFVVNRFRLYADLRRDPRRGREQADHLRQEVIGL
jgi:hypothetical protein